jgi:hypothetical protein
LNGLDRLITHIKASRDVEFMRCMDVAQGWTDKGLRPKGSR